MSFKWLGSRRWLVKLAPFAGAFWILSPQEALIIGERLDLLSPIGFLGRGLGLGLEVDGVGGEGNKGGGEVHGESHFGFAFKFLGSLLFINCLIEFRVYRLNCRAKT